MFTQKQTESGYISYIYIYIYIHTYTYIQHTCVYRCMRMCVYIYIYSNIYIYIQHSICIDICIYIYIQYSPARVSRALELPSAGSRPRRMRDRTGCFKGFLAKKVPAEMYMEMLLQFHQVEFQKSNLDCFKNTPLLQLNTPLTRYCFNKSMCSLNV